MKPKKDEAKKLYIFCPWLFGDAFRTKVGILLSHVKLRGPDEPDEDGQDVEPHLRGCCFQWTKNF